MATKTGTSDDMRWTRLIALHSRVERGLAAALRAHHRLGLSDYRALRHLAVADDGERRMHDLAALVGLDVSSVTRLVMRLERAGLVERDLCVDDGRGVYAIITKEGRQLHAAARPTYDSTLTSTLDAVDDSELRGLVRALRRS